jgi:hypothetical protein
MIAKSLRIKRRGGKSYFSQRKVQISTIVGKINPCYLAFLILPGVILPEMNQTLIQ